MAPEPAAGWNAYARVNASQRWRQLSAAMGRQVTQAIVAEAQVAEGMTVLDIASGTGEPAISIARLLKGTGSVVASDISPQALAVGEERARQSGLTNIQFAQADAHHLSFADASFDRVTCRLGIMFFADPARTLREVRRVLKPGGRASFLAWGTREQPYFETTVGTILRLLPEVALPASGAAMFKFGSPGTLSQALREAGFAHAEEHTEAVPWNWSGSSEELWQYFQDVTIPFHPLFQAIPASRRAEIDAAVLAAIRKHYENGEVNFKAMVVLASGIV
jgi:ubiquinone/menaquinone biosynthesis C-methylase UbiE